MATPDNLCGRTVGEFVLRELIGEGGFGAVYRGDQPLLGREVAVKVLHQRLHGDSEALQRFKREALLASRLDHPYAAHIYASGVEPNEGLVWIAMEFVDGVTLNRWLRTHGPLPLEEFVSWFDRVAEVIQALHDQGIVHCDVKPANVMVIERAGRLLPKLLDLGIAKLVGDVVPPLPLTPVSDDERPVGDPGRTEVVRGPSTAQRQRSPRGLTRSSATIGSPPYMAPEQWIAPTDVGPAADRYALGVVAFEALTGRPPFRAHTPRAYSDLHRLAVVPSLGPAFSLALDLASALRSAIEALPRMQIRRAARQWQERGRPVEMLWRGALLAELERWRVCSDGSSTGVELEFVEESRKHEAERMASVRRRATWVRRIAAAAAVLMVGIVFGVFQLKAAMETRMAQQEARMAQRITEVTEIAAEVEQGRAALLHDDLPEARQHLTEAYRRGDHSPSTTFMLARALQPRRAEQARLSSTAGRMWSAAFSPDGRQIVTTDDKVAQIWDARSHQPLFTLPHDDTVYHAVYSSDGTTLATAGGDSTVRLWDTSTGAALQVMTHKRSNERRSRYYLIALSPDGRTIAAIDTMGEIAQVWDATTGLELAELGNDASEFPAIAFSTDGRWLATSGGNEVRVFNTTDWKRAVTIAGPRIRSLGFDPRGSRLLTGTSDGDAAIWAIPSGTRVHHLRELGESIDAVAFSPNGELVVAASSDGAEQVWNARSGKLQSQGNYLHGKILSIDFDPTSRLIVAAGATGAVAVADAALGMPITVLEGPRALVKVAHFDPSSRTVVGASWDGTARVWDATSPYRRWSSPPVSQDCGLVTSLEPDRRFIAIGCRDHATRVWDTAHDQLLAELPPVTPPPGDFASAFPAVSAAGDRVAIARGSTVEIYELPGGRLLRTLAHRAAVSTVAFAPSGRDLVTGAIDGSILVTREGRDPIGLSPMPRGVDVAGFIGDGRVVVADASSRLRIYDADRDMVLAELATPERVGLLRPSPDAHKLITVPRYMLDAAPTLWDLEHPRIIGRLEGHVGRVFSARWISDDRVLTAGGDGSVRMWDNAGWTSQTYRGSTRFLADAAISPDGGIVVAGGADGQLRFWDAVSGRPLWITPAHRTAVVGIHFEDGSIVTRGFAGDVSRWTLPAN